ncbi:Gfo/Idh/MocA family oxidoreductase [bacterium]|nr:Gfo/Idh/MocA family oxidoreductase [bacterium]
MKVKVAFIGCGGIAGVHIDSLSKMEDVEFVSFCDVVEEKAKQRAEQFGGNVYTDYKKMLDEVEIDACYICVPPFAHEEQEEFCIEKNIPFFVEKPIHLDLNKAKEISEKVKEKNLITSTGYQDRYQDIIAYIKPFFKEGNLGIFAGWWVGGMPGIYWWRRKEMSGGQIVEQTTHIYDMTRYLIGEPVEVFAVKRKGLMKDVENYNVEDASAVDIYFDNGVVGTIFSGCFVKIAGGKVGIDFYFSDKFVEYTEREKVVINYGNKIEEIYEDSLKIIPKEDRTFIDAVKTKNSSSIKSTYEDAVKTLVFTFAANKSIETGKVEKVEL